MLRHDPFFDGPRGMFQMSHPTTCKVTLFPGQTGYKDQNLEVNMAQAQTDKVEIVVDYKSGAVTVSPGVPVTVTFRSSGMHREQHNLALKPRAPKQNYLNLRKGKWNT